MAPPPHPLDALRSSFRFFFLPRSICLAPTLGLFTLYPLSLPIQPPSTFPPSVVACLVHSHRTVLLPHRRRRQLTTPIQYPTSLLLPAFRFSPTIHCFLSTHRPLFALPPFTPYSFFATPAGNWRSTLSSYTLVRCYSLFLASACTSIQRFDCICSKG